MKGDRVSVGRKKILWVDDEIEFFRSQLTFLETRGYSVVPVFSNNDLLILLEQNESCCDLILIDEKVENVDSLQTIESIRKINKEIPIVLIAQNDSERIKKSILTKKINGVLFFPLNSSQILGIFKKLLNTSADIPVHIKENFVRSYSEIRTLLTGNPKIREFYRIYEKITFWDRELENIGDEGLRQALAGIKSDANSSFSNYVVENYGQWINGLGEHLPFLGHKVIEKKILPALGDGKKGVLFVLSGMRFDQYLFIERSLRSLYDVSRKYFIATLPSAGEFSRNALLAGELPLQISISYPGLFNSSFGEQHDAHRLEDILLYKKLSVSGIKISDLEPYFNQINISTDSVDILKKVNDCKTTQLVTFIANINEHILHAGFNAQELHDFNSNEYSLRMLADIWFQHSELFDAIKQLASKGIMVFITSDHGSVLCSRSTEMYSAEKLAPDKRYRFGKDISADERRVVFLSDPSHFGIPRLDESNSCIIAKENFYFALPEKYEFYQKEYRASFQSGGISLEELVMPLGIFAQK